MASVTLSVAFSIETPRSRDMSGSDASGALFVSGEMKPQMEAISTMRLARVASLHQPLIPLGQDMSARWTHRISLRLKAVCLSSFSTSDAGATATAAEACETSEASLLSSVSEPGRAAAAS